jgi:hypothetical protein
METFHSDDANALALVRSWLDVRDEADAWVEATGEQDATNVLETGFSLAMKLVQMSALAKYAGKTVGVWVVSGQGYESFAYFLAADEEEVLARLRPIAEDETADEEDETDEG